MCSDSKWKGRKGHPIAKAGCHADGGIYYKPLELRTVLYRTDLTEKLGTDRGSTGWDTNRAGAVGIGGQCKLWNCSLQNDAEQQNSVRCYYDSSDGGQFAKDRQYKSESGSIGRQRIEKDQLDDPRDLRTGRGCRRSHYLSAERDCKGYESKSSDRFYRDDRQPEGWNKANPDSDQYAAAL